METRGERKNRVSHNTQRRLSALIAIFGYIFLFFLGLLARYQILGPLNKEAFILPVFSQRQKGVPITLPRGNIVDRNGVPIHAPVWDATLVAFPESIKDKNEAAMFLAQVLGQPAEKVYEKLSSSTEPFKVARELTPQVVDMIMSNPMDGLALVPEEKRYGPSSLARHAVGYIRPNAYFDPRDSVGESGLEKEFNAALSGQGFSWAGVVTSGDGSMLSQGVQVARTGQEPRDLVSTLDVGIQKEVEEVLDKRGVQKGAVVVLDADTASVLAMASRPEFDQNHPEKSMGDSSGPFVNRAISAFAPGSTWKPLIFALALEKGIASPADLFTCSGPFTVGDRVINCGSGKGGHGRITLEEALAKSCNYVFSQVALKMSPQDLVDFAYNCGFGRATGISLPDEAAGVLPDPATMYPGDIVNYAIGQGYLTVTPLQMAAFFRAIVAGGVWAKPAIIMGEPREEKRIFSESTARSLEKALLLTTSGQDVTGTLAWVEGYGSAGKTGTAETGTPGKTHAWFCGWTPVIRPEYVICVLVEEGGQGAMAAAPLFREIAERILYPGDDSQ